MGKLAQKIANNETIFTAEITPPKGAGTKKLLKHAAEIGPLVDAINITDCQRALVKMSSMAAAKVLLDNGFEPVCQITCRDRNSIALQSDFMGASALGIPNILCLTGDPVKVGDNPTAKSVFEVEAIGMLHILKHLQRGQDNSGLKMNKATQFCVGAVVNPTLRSQNQLQRMEKKIEAGAQFFQTQANYDLDDYEAFLKEARRLKTKILGGVLVLHSYEIAQYIKDNIPGVHVPESLLFRLKGAKDQAAEGIEFAVETMHRIKPYTDGFHLMTVREEELIPKVMEAYAKS